MTMNIAECRQFYEEMRDRCIDEASDYFDKRYLVDLWHEWDRRLDKLPQDAPLPSYINHMADAATTCSISARQTWMDTFPAAVLEVKIGA